MTALPSSETMTLEQVRDALRSQCEMVYRDSHKYPECAYHVPDHVLDELADAIDVHLTAERREREGYRWQPISTAPTDSTPHLRGLRVYTTCGGYPDEYWDVYAGYIGEDHMFYDLSGDVIGWSANDFTHWAPLADAPD